jgi:hypothetical protein
MQHIERNDKRQQQEQEQIDNLALETVDELGKLMNDSTQYGMSVGKVVSLAATMGLLDAEPGQAQ